MLRKTEWWRTGSILYSPAGKADNTGLDFRAEKAKCAYSSGRKLGAQQLFFVFVFKNGIKCGEMCMYWISLFFYFAVTYTLTQHLLSSARVMEVAN